MLNHRKSIRSAILSTCSALALGPVAGSWSWADVERVMPVPPGVHPRLLFTGDELPLLRQRSQTPRYVPLLEALGGSSVVLARELAKAENDAAARTQLAKDALSQWGYHPKRCREAALHYQLTNDPAAGQTAAAGFRFWLAAHPPVDRIVPRESWGSQEYALAYDWIYELLDEGERDQARRLFAAMLGQPTRDMLDREWFAFGPTVTGRRLSGANWMALCGANLAVTALAIEGEGDGGVEVDPSILPDALRMVQSFLAECLDSDGALYEGMEYAMGFGTHHLPPLLMALRRRGSDSHSGSHLARLADWVAGETLPWGFESFDHNKSSGRFAAGPILTFAAREFGGQFLNVYRQAAIEAAGIIPDAMVGLLNGLPEGDPPPLGELPLDRWFSARGLVFARSGWGERDALAMFGVNPVGAGHSHADQGNFLLAANGAYFIADSGAGNYDSHFHNLVHIDGVGQGRREGGLEGFIRFADRNDYALLADADLKLSYSRVLAGPLNGPWWWEEHNPVERADRRFLFVRGVAGPLLIVVDDIRKDSQARQYAWLANVPERLRVVAEGDGFTVAERYGGAYLHTLDKGCRAALVAAEVAAGTYHGWLLVRSEPSPVAWASNNLSVNGVKVPYNEAYFGRGFHREGWEWLPLKPGGKAEIVHPGGELRVGLESHSGGRIALAVFSRDLDWTPGDTVPESGDRFVVLGRDSIEQSEPPWEIGHAPMGVLDARFLGSPVDLRLDGSRLDSTRRLVLRAERNVADGRFVCVMAPHDDGDGRHLVSFGGSVQRQSAGGTDIIVSGWQPHDQSPVASDAQVAVVSQAGDGRTIGYAMVAGSTLKDAAGTLVAAPAGSHLLHDGRRLLLRAVPGGTVSCRRLQAQELLVNGRPLALPEGDPLLVAVPVEELGWTVELKDDGRRIEMTGSGPQPPPIEAPKAIELWANDIKRQFTRDEQGLAYPVLGDGVRTIHYRNRFTVAELKKYETGRDGATIHYALPALPGRYRVGAGTAVEERTTHTDTLAVTVPVAAAMVEMTPLTTPLPAPLWLASGPFAIPGFDGQDMGADTVRAALTHRLPPEEQVDPNATYENHGQPRRWRPGDSQEGWRNADGDIVPVKQWVFADNASESGVNFMPVCGVRRGELCYAATVIHSPSEREALLQIGCDYWATAFVNGQEVDSERPEILSRLDGAQFNGDTLMNARIRLRQGRNLLLVKCRGGGGSNSFVARLSDPGDLEFRLPAP